MIFFMRGILALVGLLALPVLAHAQAGGPFVRPGCTSLTSPVAHATACFDTTAGKWKVWDGATWVGALATHAGTVNVKDYGARGDATTDDTASVQAAITAARAANATVVVPPGTYVITGSLTDTTSGTVPGLRLIGAGARSTVFDWRGASAAMLRLDGGAASTFQQYGRLADFRITTTTSPVASHGIQLRAAWGLQIEQVWIDSLTGDAIRVAISSGDADSVAHLHIRDCRLEGNTGYGFNDASGAGISALAFLTIENCYIRANTAGGIRWSGQLGRILSSTIAQNGGDGGLYIRQNGVAPQQLAVENNEFDSNLAQHIKIDGGLNLVLRNNQLTFQALTPPGAFGPTTGLLIGDGATALQNVVVSGTRVRSTPTNPSSATTVYSVAANATYTLIQDTAWQAFSGANATRVADAGVLTMIRDDGLWTQAALTFTRTSGAGPFTPSTANGPFQELRMTTAGAVTVNQPTGAAAGRELLLVVFNDSGGAITVTFNAAYLTTGYTDPANGKRRSARFAYNPTAGVWIQIGDWSGDL